MAKGQKTGGRTRGTPNKTTLAVKEALTSAFDQIGGGRTLADWAQENQTEFYKLWVKILPQEIRAELTGENGGPIKTEATVQIYLPDNKRK